MQKLGRYLGKWELGCLVFLLCILHPFLFQPMEMSWISVLFGGVLFLLLLGAFLRFSPSQAGRGWQLYRRLTVLYWFLSGILLLRRSTDLLQQTAFFESPPWFLILFLLLGAAAPVLFGNGSVYRLFALFALPIGLVFFLLILFRLPEFHLTYLFPFWEQGGRSILRQGLKTLSFYLDIPFLFPLIFPRGREPLSSKSVFSGAVLGVLWNLLLALFVNLSVPRELTLSLSNPLFPTAKSGVGLLFFYLTATISAIILYLALALQMVIRRPTGRKVLGAGLLCLLLCFSLTGCYDSQEVEETAYLLALGVDKGTDASYRYTFQISNPLNTGGDSQPTSQEDTNQGVLHITAESESIYSALSDLRSRLGKEPDLSHLKVLVFSKELAREGLLPQASVIAQIPKLRPNTMLCLSDSAEEFLSGVKPTLEESTSRYYQLLFQPEYSPYAPLCTLQEFLLDAQTTGKDPLLPMVASDRLAGAGFFDQDRLVLEGDTYQAVLYQILSGNAKNLTLSAGKSVFALSKYGSASLEVSTAVTPPLVTVTVPLSARLLEGTESDLDALIALLETDTADFLQQTAALSSDILGFGNAFRKKFPTQASWDAYLREDAASTASIRINLRIYAK